MARPNGGHLRLVSSRDWQRPPSDLPPPSSTIIIEIDAAGALRKIEVSLRKEDALQALNGLAMAQMRALDVLMH